MMTIANSVPSRAARRRDRQQAIIEIAAAAFFANGYSATTMSDIATVLGGSKTTLWSHFPSKRALFEAILDRATADYSDLLQSLLDPSEDLNKTLRAFCTRLLEKVTAPSSVALQRLVYAEAGRFPELGTLFYERGPLTSEGQLADYVAMMVDRGTVICDDPVQAAQQLKGVCLSGCHYRLLVGQLDTATPELIAVDVNNAVDMFMKLYASPIHSGAPSSVDDENCP